MKKYYLITIGLLLVLTGCSESTTLLSSGLAHSNTKYYNKPTGRKLHAYEKTMKYVGAGIRHDKRYKRINLNTPEKKNWFKMLTYRLWDRQITRQEFISEGLSKYPTHRYEFEFVIKGFEKAYR